MERKNWPWRKKLEEMETQVSDVHETRPAAIAPSEVVTGQNGAGQEAVSERGKGQLQEFEKEKLEIECESPEMERMRNENALLVASLQDVGEANRRAQHELRALRVKLQASDRDKARFKYELNLLNKQLRIQNEEKELGDTKQQIAEIVPEYHRLQGSLSRKARDPPHTEDDDQSSLNDNEDDISRAESWASALLSELDHFKPKQCKNPNPNQDLTELMTQMLQLIQPVAFHLQVDTAQLVEAKEKVSQDQDQPLLHFLQHLYSVLTCILSRGNGFHSGVLESLNKADAACQSGQMQAEIDKLHGQIDDLDKKLQSEIKQRRDLSALNDKLQKDVEEYAREKDACINQQHKEEDVTEDSEKLAECRRTIQDLGQQLKALVGYEEKEKEKEKEKQTFVWEEQEQKHERDERPASRSKSTSRTPLFRRLFLCCRRN